MNRTFFDHIIQFLVQLKMNLSIRPKLWLFLHATKNPEKTQKRILFRLLKINSITEYGKCFNFQKVHNYNEFIKNVPVNDYESIRENIINQDNTKKEIIIKDKIAYMNQTSGTTGLPKYIPVTNYSYNQAKNHQEIYSLFLYDKYPKAFLGKVLGMAAPAIEGYLPSGTSFGSASGRIYKNIPNFAKKKYVLPEEIFSIENYDAKYYTIAYFSILEKNISMIGTANPSSILRIIETIFKFQEILLDDVKNGTFHYKELISKNIWDKIQKRIKPNFSRYEELSLLSSMEPKKYLNNVWPFLTLISTWQTGSCGIPLNELKNNFPTSIDFVELGFIASETRVTIPFFGDSNLSLPILNDVFYEFVEQSIWESGNSDFKMITELEENKNYYIFITTFAGLYRYNMNDIITVTGFFNKTPCLKFLQKGKGITNITGEKLSEFQFIKAIDIVSIKHDIIFHFYQVLANPETNQYEFYYELAKKNKVYDRNQLLCDLEEELKILNIEYKNKRDSQRLKLIQIFELKPGAYERIKIYFLELGQRESQFKTIALQWKNDFPYDLSKEIEYGN